MTIRKMFVEEVILKVNPFKDCLILIKSHSHMKACRLMFV